MVYPALTWNIATKKKELFFTFDDGPHPVATPFVLDALKQYDAKATFFCIGKNVAEHPGIYRRILEEGHRVGNHTHNHLNGWKTATDVYVENVAEAKRLIGSNLFRPPYGRISRMQIAQLHSTYKIIMWDVLSGDFDVQLSKQKALNYVITRAVPGSIIVFHDSDKAFERLEFALPKALAFFSEQGYVFKSIV